MLRDMKTHTHLKPGQSGTKRLVEQYGDALLCVRYRRDEQRGVTLKTVELVVGEIPFRTGSGYRDDEIVSVVVAYGEKVLRDRLKAAGGRWDPVEKLWQVAYGVIRGDGELEDRIVSKRGSR